MKKRIFCNSPPTTYHSPYGETTYKPAFTIIELLVVIVIIGILSAITFVTYNGIQGRAIATSLQSDLTNASDQLVIDQARSGPGSFPATMAAANGGAGISTLFSTGTTPAYTVNNTNTPKTFCLTATKSNQSYFITQEGIPLPGPCPVLYLDASIPTSYPETGTTWIDLSGNGNNAVLSGDVSFSSTNGGSLVFDGVNDYGTVTNNATLNFASEQTLLIVMKHSFTTLRRVIWDQAYGGYGTWTHEYGGSINQYFGSNGADGGSYTWNNSPATPTNVWNFMCISRNTVNHKWYINGNLGNTIPNPYGVLTNTAANIRIGLGYTGEYWQGNIALVMAYDKALSDSQIKSIYDALRGRYGI